MKREVKVQVQKARAEESLAEIQKVRLTNADLSFDVNYFSFALTNVCRYSTNNLFE